MSTIMIVDDDIYIGNMLEEALQKKNYETLRAYSGTEAIYVLEENRPDLILLDLMLPGITGEALLPKIKNIPVIVVSAKVGIDDKVNLLTQGAVDYVTKPFSIDELMARIAIHLRSNGLQDEESLCCNGVWLNEISHEVSIDGYEVHLTKTEYAILRLLMRNAGNAMAKSVILDRIGEDTPDCTDASLKQHISNLRKKLRDVSKKEYIEAIWGIGFRFIKE